MIHDAYIAATIIAILTSKWWTQWLGNFAQ